MADPQDARFTNIRKGWPLWVKILLVCVVAFAAIVLTFVLWPSSSDSDEPEEMSQTTGQAPAAPQYVTAQEVETMLAPMQAQLDSLKVSLADLRTAHQSEPEVTSEETPEGPAVTETGKETSPPADANKTAPKPKRRRL